ncbi:unnamed protein product [Gongylonema pulchrum]|uniref:Intraflagellar transport protein 46 homolog n=1 Tax=Gongylonema pulchrum TaxID=637853 RepID=A0A3P6QB09_9BILA|nr:unnamed protein product [Gongylonema pulchrum]
MVSFCGRFDFSSTPVYSLIHEFLSGHPGTYPEEPPPAYSSGDHTPEEHPLIDEDDDELMSSPFDQQRKPGSTVGAIVQGIAGLAVAPALSKSPSSETMKLEMKNDGRPGEGHDQTNESLAPLGSDEKELLGYIEAYTAETVHIETLIKPFLLDYIPAVGDVDAFIKIPRPDEVFFLLIRIIP